MGGIDKNRCYSNHCNRQNVFGYLCFFCYRGYEPLPPVNTYFMIGMLVRPGGHKGEGVAIDMILQLVPVFVSRMVEGEMNLAEMLRYNGFMRIVCGYEKEGQRMRAFHPDQEIRQYANGRF